MGSWWSFFRGSPKYAEEIETNVLDLILKLDEQEVKIDSYVKIQISKALDVYKQVIKKEKKVRISREKASKIEDLIDVAKKKVEGLAEHRHESKSVEDDMKGVHSIRNYLSEVQTRVENDEIPENDFEHLLEKVSICAQTFSKKHSMAVEANEQQALYILFLKIFLKCPSLKSSQILEEILKNFDKIIENFERIDINNVDVFNSEKIKKQMVDVSTKTTLLNKKLQDGIRVMDKMCGETSAQCGSVESKYKQPYPKTHSSKISSPKTKILLDSFNTKLSDYKKILEKFCPPVDEKNVDKLKYKIDGLIDQIKKVRVDPEMMKKKELIYDRSQDILLKLKNIDDTSKKINQHLKFLKNAEDEISLVFESGVNFEEKERILKAYVEKINAIDDNFNEVSDRKMEILNKIEGFYAVELINFLRQEYKRINQHKLQVQQFPFPTRSAKYELKRNEIIGLFNSFGSLPEDYPVISQRKQILKERIEEVLEVLERRAKTNETIISALEHLENIKKEVVAYNADSSLSSFRKLEWFLTFRKRLVSIDYSIDNRITLKKTEILSLLHNFETHIFSSFPSFIQKMKTTLDQHELEIQQFNAEPTAVFNQRTEIMLLLENVNSVIGKSSSFISNILSKICNLLLQRLETNLKRSEQMLQRLQSLDDIEQSVNRAFSEQSSLEQRTKVLEHAEFFINEMKKYNIDDISTKLSSVEDLICIAKSKVNLELKKHEFGVLKDMMANQVFPKPARDFKAFLNEVLSLKEHVEDIPQGDPQVDSQKTDFVKEIFNSLEQMGVPTTHLVNTKNHEPILELKNHFDFKIDATQIERNSEFVRMIRGRANTFEDGVRNYLGSSYSVDYYGIHENLLRLLEELDKVTCADDDEILLKEIVETMDYIKSLIGQLSSNASAD